MTVFNTHSESIESLMIYIQSNNVDISTQEKFTEAIKSWYVAQRQMDKKIDQLPFNVLKNILQIN